jgi:uncharacterized protein (DUF2267 family)
MSTTGFEVFDETFITTNAWMHEIADRLGCDRKTAWHVLGGVLGALRDRLPNEVAANLGAQLPLLVRGIYYEGYRPQQHPHGARTLDAFLATVCLGLDRTYPVEPRNAVIAVLRTLAQHVEPGQARRIWEALPSDVRALGHDRVVH